MVTREFRDGQQGIIFYIEVVYIAKSNVFLLNIFVEEWVVIPTTNSQIFNGVLDYLINVLFMSANCSVHLFSGAVSSYAQNFSKAIADCFGRICCTIVFCIDSMSGVNHQFSKSHIHYCRASFSIICRSRCERLRSACVCLRQHHSRRS